MRAWIDVAVLAKSRNLDGRFVVKSTTGLPFLLEEGDEVALVPPKLDVPRRVTVAQVAEIDDATAEVRFEGVEDAETAGQLVGMHCLMRRDLVELEHADDAPALWDGWTVVDSKEGVIGTVSGLVENPGQILIEVDRGGSTVLVPVVDEIVIDVDAAGRCVHVDLPAGLLELSF